ncbi:MAG: hypothetical protein FWD80_03290 [Propionibacteriaceae bacterium]|nr:hypothetical protein [Propionibacteriaceae bacterium]
MSSTTANRPRGQRGMVTAELAIGILSATMVAFVLSWGVHLIAVQTVCADVAAQVARAEARGDAAAANEARQHAPDGATLDIAKTGTEVHVTVSVRISLGRLISMPVTGQAAMPKEPGT